MIDWLRTLAYGTDEEIESMNLIDTLRWLAQEVYELRQRVGGLDE